MNPTRPTRLPAEVHTDCRLSSNPPRSRCGVPPHGAHRVIPVIWHRPIDRRKGWICLTVLLFVALLFALLSAFGGAGGSISADGLGQSLGQGLLHGGLPPTGDSGVGGSVAGTDSADGTDDAAGTDDTADMTDTRPQDPEEDTKIPETEAVSPSESDTEDLREPTTQPADDETDVSPDESEAGEPLPETDPAVEPESTPVVPNGCYPVVTLDMSWADRGAGHIVGNLEALPVTLPDGEFWGGKVPSAVLIVNTHPYEAYSDGAAWYDPAEGGLALTDTPNAADGTVALGAELARTLRGMGVTVIHLRIAVSAEDSASDIYERTETVIRSYCRLYPDIGLVLDLRRSAELTEDGGVLRTAGHFEDDACAQLRISVSGGREKTAFARDLAVALALREGLWGMEPSVSRPVRVKTGNGLVGDLDDVCVLTMEMGSAGNTYMEAERLAAPVAAVLSGLILDGADL